MKILHYLKKFILFIIKEIFSFFIKLFLFSILNFKVSKFYYF